jgi:hypothetical protein
MTYSRSLQQPEVDNIGSSQRTLQLAGKRPRHLMLRISLLAVKAFIKDQWEDTVDESCVEPES